MKLIQKIKHSLSNGTDIVVFDFALYFARMAWKFHELQQWTAALLPKRLINFMYKKTGLLKIRLINLRFLHTGQHDVRDNEFETQIYNNECNKMLETFISYWILIFQSLLSLMDMKIQSQSSNEANFDTTRNFDWTVNLESLWIFQGQPEFAGKKNSNLDLNWGLSL